MILHNVIMQAVMILNSISSSLPLTDVTDVGLTHESKFLMTLKTQLVNKKP